MPRFPRFRLLVLPAVLAAALALTACSGESATPTPPRPTATPGGAITRIYVEMTSFDFIPEDLEFSVGETVEFDLFSKDIEHDFTVEALDIHWSVDGGERATEQFTFDRVGTYRLICTVPAHEAAGMIGEIVVR